MAACVDRTELFKATVKAARSLRIHLGEDTSKDAIFSQVKGKKSSKFSQLAHDVVNDVSKMQQFLLKNRSDYINSAGYWTKTDSMSDEERDAIDKNTAAFIQNCTENIGKLQKEVYADGSGSSQVTSHREAVLELVKMYLKQVCRIHSEQKAIRLKRTVERKQLSRLHKHTQKVQRRLNSEDDISEPLSAVSDGSSVNEQRMADPSTVDELTSEESKEFHEENIQLTQKLNDLSDEVRSIEDKVVRISELQSLFTEKVMEQARNVDLIVDNTITSTENVRMGNEQLREAIQNRATYRAVILFILIVLSVTLLFLNWYN